MHFKVTGMSDGKHTIEAEDGGRFSLSDGELAKHAKEHSRLGTNDEWPNRPKDEPVAKGDGKPIDLKPIHEALKTMGTEHDALVKRVEALEAAAEKPGK